MICKICGEKKNILPVFSVHICQECMKEFNTIEVLDENYDYYKNMIRIFLSYYVGRRLIEA